MTLATPNDRARSLPREWLGFCRRRPAFTSGLVLLTIIVLIAIFAPLLTPYDPTLQSLADRRLPPAWSGYFYGNPKATWDHPLGTDTLGRDIWSRLVYGTRVSLAIGIGGALICVLIGTVLGVAAGYWGGWVDLAVGFLIQIRLAVPVMLIGLIVVSSLGGSVLLMILICGFLLWDRPAVVMRAATQQIVSQEYINAARVVGYRDLVILVKEILPNLVAPITLMMSIEIGYVVMLEAGLSFIGLGIPPPTPSWGLMIAEAKTEIFFAPSAIMMPGIALFTLVLATSLIADGLRKKK